MRKDRKSREIVERYMNGCARCFGLPINDGPGLEPDCRWWESDHFPVHLHHIKAKSEGGDDQAENMIPLCSSCHEEWHDFEHFVPFREWLDTFPARYAFILFREFSKDPAGWKGYTLLDVFRLWATERAGFVSFDEVVWLLRRRDTLLDEHEELYGKQPHYHLKDPRRIEPLQLAFDSV